MVMTSGERIGKVRKRDGSIVEFDASKIERAIQRAAVEVLQDRRRADGIARRVTQIVVENLAGQYKGKTPGVEEIQDLIEAALMSEGYNRIAKSYILYRENRSQVRFAKSALGLKDDLKLPVNAVEVLRRRYLLKDEARRIVETPSELFRRVAHHVAQAEANYGSDAQTHEVEDTFYRMMRNREFMPNSPTLMNAGHAAGTALRVLRDSGGGFRSRGFSRPWPTWPASTRPAAARASASPACVRGATWSARPRDAPRAPSPSWASSTRPPRSSSRAADGGGPTWACCAATTRTSSISLRPRSAPTRLRNFNLSVGVTDKFMRAVVQNRPFDLVNPHTGRSVKQIGAHSLFDLIVNAAWRTGDPGLIFLDHVNRDNPTPEIGRIEATNPCGEVPLLPYESCILASINLDRMTTDDDAGKPSAGRPWIGTSSATESTGACGSSTT